MKMLSMIGSDETSKLLDESIFSGLDVQSREKLYPLFERKSVSKGEMIRKINEEVGDLFIVESGAFYETSADNSVLATYGRGQCIGALSSLFSVKQVLNTQATEDSVVLQIDAGSLVMLEYSDPRLLLQLWRCIRSAVSPQVDGILHLMYELYQD